MLIFPLPPSFFFIFYFLEIKKDMFGLKSFGVVFYVLPPLLSKKKQQHHLFKKNPLFFLDILNDPSQQETVRVNDFVYFAEM